MKRNSKMHQSPGMTVGNIHQSNSLRSTTKVLAGNTAESNNNSQYGFHQQNKPEMRAHMGHMRHKSEAIIPTPGQMPPTGISA